jgi:hypothetical protein
MNGSAEKQCAGGSGLDCLVGELDERGADEVVYFVVGERRSCGGDELLFVDSSPCEMGEVPVDLVEEVLEEVRVRRSGRRPGRYVVDPTMRSSS